jgi:hypothetical protein
VLELKSRPPALLEVVEDRMDVPGGMVTDGRISDVRRHEASIMAGLLKGDGEGCRAVRDASCSGLPSSSVEVSFDILGATVDVDDSEDVFLEPVDDAEPEEVTKPCPLCPE